MIFAFAPVVGLLLGLSSLSAVGDAVPVGAAVYRCTVIVASLWRRWLLNHEHGYLRLQQVLIGCSRSRCSHC